MWIVKHFYKWFYIHFSSLKWSGCNSKIFLFHKIPASDNCAKLTDKEFMIRLRFKTRNGSASLVIWLPPWTIKKILFGCFAVYPSFVAGILNKAERIHFFVLWIENLNYEYYIGKFISDKECSVSYKAGPLFQISYHGEAFKARIFPNRPSELMFAQCLEKQNTAGLSSLRNNDS